jgi:hypothetical protein
VKPIFVDWYLAGKEGSKETMAYAMKPPKQLGAEEPQEQIHKIRITLTSKNVKNLEKGNPEKLCFLGFFFSVIICDGPLLIWLLTFCTDMTHLGFYH